MTVQSSAPTHRVGSAETRRGLAPSRLKALLSTLEDERAFRRAQLAQLTGGGAGELVPDARSDSDSRAAAIARQTVNEVIAAGARRTLNDIDLALTRIGTGAYGRCLRCDAAMPSAVLDAVPWASLCPGCHRARDGRG